MIRAPALIAQPALRHEKTQPTRHAGISPAQIPKAHFSPAKDERQAVIVGRTANMAETQLPQLLVKALNAIATQQLHHGDVQRAHQSMPGSYNPLIRGVIIVGAITGNRHRIIRQQAAGRNQALLERQGIEEGLENAAGTARRRNDVDVFLMLRSRAGHVAYVGQHPARSDLHDERGHVVDAAALELSQAVTHALQSPLLQIALERRAQTTALLSLLCQLC